MIIWGSNPKWRIRETLKNLPSLSQVSYISVSLDQEIRDVCCHVHIGLVHLFHIYREQLCPLVSHDDVDDGFKDYCIGRRRTWHIGHCFKDRDCFVKVFAGTAVSVDERREVGAGQFDRHVVLQFVEDVFHGWEVDGLNGTIGIEKKLVKEKVIRKRLMKSGINLTLYV